MQFVEDDALQHTATYCNMLQRTATHCNTLQHTATSAPSDPARTLRMNGMQFVEVDALQHTATHCNKLQHTATYYNTLLRTATHWNTFVSGDPARTLRMKGMQFVEDDTLQHTATHCNTLQNTATHCNTLQYTATHCNVLQRTATYYNTLQHMCTRKPSARPAHEWREVRGSHCRESGGACGGAVSWH